MSERHRSDQFICVICDTRWDSSGGGVPYRPPHLCMSPPNLFILIEFSELLDFLLLWGETVTFAPGSMLAQVCSRSGPGELVLSLVCSPFGRPGSSLRAGATRLARRLPGRTFPLREDQRWSWPLACSVSLGSHRFYRPASDQRFDPESDTRGPDRKRVFRAASFPAAHRQTLVI